MLGQELGAVDVAESADQVRGLVDLITGAWRTQAVYAAVRLDVFDHVAEGRRDDAALAGATGVECDRVVRLLRLLVGLDLVRRDEDGGYSLTGAGEHLTRGDPRSVRDMCLLYGAEFYTAWHHLLPALEDTGRSGFEHAYGEDTYDYLGERPEVAGRFQRGLRAGYRIVCEALPRLVDLAGQRIVDVGGGNGALLAAVLAAEPGARGVLVDLPHMADTARVALAEVAPGRVEIRAGDMFESVPPDGDVYLLSRVLGDWDAEACAAILENCRRRMQADTRLVVVERVVPTVAETLLPELWDLHLMVMHRGRQRTRAELDELLVGAGLVVRETVALPLETTALVLTAA